MIQLLLLEDDPAIAQTLLFALKKEGFLVAWADTLAKGFEYLASLNNLSALILDVGLPDGTGFEFCQKVRTGDKFSSVPIVFLTARSEESERILGLELGADDYVAKPFSPNELIARIKAIFRRQELILQSLSQKTTKDNFTKTLLNHHWQYHANQYTLSLDGIPLTLSKTELAIMLTLLDSPTQIFSREQLLTNVCDHPEHRLARTIDAHIKSLRQKLASVCNDELIKTHRGIGYGLASE